MRKPTPFLDDADADEVDRPKVVSQQLRTISELMELMELFSMQWCPKEACRYSQCIIFKKSQTHVNGRHPLIIHRHSLTSLAHKHVFFICYAITSDDMLSMYFFFNRNLLLIYNYVCIQYFQEFVKFVQTLLVALLSQNERELIKG